MAPYGRSLTGAGVSRVQDLGSGIGRHVVLFAREGFEVHGMEPAASGVAYWQEVAQ